MRSLRQINAIWRQIEKNAFLSSTELKLRLPRTLANINARTVRRILFYDLDRPARFAALKPDLTEQNKMGRLAWVKTNMRKLRRTWDHILFCDEVRFEAQGRGGSWRLVRRPRGVRRSHPAYCRRRFKKPRAQMALAGITSSGARFLTFLKANTTMKSRDYCELILRDAKPMMDHHGLTILHNRSKVLDCKYTFTFFKRNGIKTKLLPAKSPDLNVIEHLLGLIKRKLVKQPTRSLKVLCIQCFFFTFIVYCSQQQKITSFLLTLSLSGFLIFLLS